MGNLSAMVKLNLYLIDIQEINQGNLSTIIPRYVEDCEEMNDENKIMELTPEELVGTHLCLPERTIGGPDPSEWTNIMYTKTFGIPDKLSTINEHYPVQSSRSNRLEEMVKEKHANSGDKKMEINSSRNDTRVVADEKLDIEISDVIGNSEMNSSRDDNQPFANKKLEKSKEISDVIENSEDNLEINSNKDDTQVFADEKLETPNIEISDVIENSEINSSRDDDQT